MTVDDLLPYLRNPLAWAAFAIGASHAFEAVTRALAKRAASTADASDDVIAAKWVSRAEWMRTATDALVRWFVPQAFAPTRDEMNRTPAIERVEGDEQ